MQHRASHVDNFRITEPTLLLDWKVSLACKFIPGNEICTRLALLCCQRPLSSLSYPTVNINCALQLQALYIPSPSPYPIQYSVVYLYLMYYKCIQHHACMHLKSFDCVDLLSSNPDAMRTNNSTKSVVPIVYRLLALDSSSPLAPLIDNSKR